MREKIAAARVVVLRWSHAALFRGSRHEARLGAAQKASNDVETILGAYGLVMTPAQAPAFFTRSADWRCTACGKVHSFEQLVPVSDACPCTCASIEFEAQREVAFAHDPTLTAIPYVIA
jgi:hypothetical protein